MATPESRTVAALPEATWSPLGVALVQKHPVDVAPRQMTPPEMDVAENSGYVSIWGSNPELALEGASAPICVDAVDYFIAMRRALVRAPKHTAKLREVQRFVVALGREICKRSLLAHDHVQPALDAMSDILTDNEPLSAVVINDVKRMHVRAAERDVDRRAIPASMSHPGMDEVVPGVFVGSWHAANDLGQLQELRITNVVTLTGARPFTEQGIRYLSLTLSDTETANLESIVPEAVAFVKKRLFGRGETVLIHCSAGCSRAPALAAAILADILRIEGLEALHVVERHRPCSCPNPGFQKQLATLEFS